MSGTRVVIYVRISRDRAGESLGVQRQERECRELCEREGWSVVDVLVDNDVSAYSGRKRPGYEALLTMIRNGRVDVVVAWNTDRLHRRLRELVDYSDACAPRNVTTHTVRTGPIDLSTPSGILVAQQLGAVAEYESRNRGARVRAASRQRAESGRYAGGPRPFGWDADGETERPEEADMLRGAIRDVLRGESLNTIARKFRGSGVPTPKGGAWTARRVRTMLLAPRIAGLRVYREKIIGTAVWEPLVPVERWYAVKKTLEDPARVTNRQGGVTPRHLGTNRYVCGAPLPDGAECRHTLDTGRSFRVSKDGDKTSVRTYKCVRQDKQGVPHVTVDRDALDALVREKLVGAMLEQGFGPAGEPDTTDEDSPSDVVAEIEAAQEALSLELAEGHLPAAAFRVANARLTARMEEVTAQQVARVERVVQDERLRGFDRDPFGVWDALPLDVRRGWLDDLVTVVVLPASRRSFANGARLIDRLRFDWKQFDPLAG